MKVPISWLKEYVDFEATPQELAKRLTFSGTEVEAIRTVGSSFEGIVVGEVRDTAPHPDADGLLVCRVNDGRKMLNVVCGAHNFQAGDKIPFVGVGGRLPGGQVIEKSAIRGVESEGMLCAEDELGLSDDHSGVMLLPRDAPAGMPLSEVLGPPETVLELEVTWNRPDCLSVIGIARELAALFGSRLKMPPVDFAESDQRVEDLVQVTIEDPRGCTRYTARVMWDIRLGPSPFWMRRRLSLAGARAINNVVDVTNYVMLECGHPLHAFDYELVADHRIIVRRAWPGEKMATLDGVERAITAETVLIADPRKALALGGVMGGAGSEIRGATTRVLVESACFDPARIRNTSSKLGLSTESSYRFERGVDVTRVDWASRRATALMAQLAGAVVARGVADVFPAPPRSRDIPCRFQRVRDLYGVEVSNDRIVSILTALEIPVVAQDAVACTARAPGFRPDLEIEADLIEEVARLHGLDKVPTVAPEARVVPDVSDAPTQALIRCRTNLAGVGFAEIMNYSFLAPELLDRFSPADTGRRVVLPNPVSAEYGVMRDSLIPQMVDSLGWNLFHQTETAAFFETGRVFLRDDTGTVYEEERLSLGLLGRPGRTALDRRRPVEPPEMFLWLKGAVEHLAALQHLKGLSFAPGEAGCFEPGQAVSVLAEGRAIGVMGLLRPGIRAEYRMNGPVAVAELSLAALLARSAALPEIRSAPAFPSVTRDVAMVVPESLTHEEILRVIQAHAPKELTSVELFDMFRGEGIRKGHKSLAYSLVYRSDTRTLTDEDANRYHEAVKNALKSDLGVEIREK